MHSIIPLLVAVYAAWWDLRNGKVPNRVIIAGLIMGLFYRLYTDGTYGILIFFLYAAWPVILLYILFVLRSLGAGDIKLFAVISVFLETEPMISLILLSFFLGAIISLLRMLIHKELFLRLNNIKTYVSGCIAGKRIMVYHSLPGEGSYMEFSVCILMGLILIYAGEYYGGYPGINL